MSRSRKPLDTAARAKGQAALAKWREEQKKLKAAGIKTPAKTKLIKITPLQAIKAFCLACVGDSINDVRKCTAYNCALYPLRPYK